MDARHTGRSPYAGPTKLEMLRSYSTVDAAVDVSDPGDPRPDIQSSAAIGQDGTIYIGNFRGSLFALRDPGQGANLNLLWRFHPANASSFHQTPAIGPDGTIYIGFSTGGATPEAKGTFYALRAPASGADPQIAWQVDLGPGRQTSSPTLGPDGTIYAVSGAGRLLALAPDGSTKWSVSTGPSLKAAPALGSDGTVYLSSMNGKLYAVAPPAGGSREGTVRWTFDFAANPGKTPIVVAPTPSPGAPAPPPGANGVGSGASPTIGQDGTIYVGANNSNFYAVDPDSKLRWMYEAEREVAGIWSSAALSADEKTLYFGANKGGIYALDAQSGALRWRSFIYGSVYNSPSLDSKGVLYTGSTAGHVIAIDSASGKVLVDYDAGAPVWTVPAIRPDGSLVVGDLRGRIRTLG